jgi:hypothetical protein
MAAEESSLKPAAPTRPRSMNAAMNREDRRQSAQRDPTMATLLITGIPAQYNSITAIHGHFAKFGTVTNIQVVADKARAFVKFA